MLTSIYEEKNIPNKHNLEIPKWMDGAHYMTNVPYNNDELSDEEDVIDEVYLHVDDKKGVWLSVFPEGEYYGSIELKKGESIESIRGRITAISGHEYASSYNDYWEEALREMCMIENELYYHEDVSNESYRLLFMMLMSIKFPVEDDDDGFDIEEGILIPGIF